MEIIRRRKDKIKHKKLFTQSSPGITTSMGPGKRQSTIIIRTKIYNLSLTTKAYNPSSIFSWIREKSIHELLLVGLGHFLFPYTY